MKITLLILIVLALIVFAYANSRPSQPLHTAAPVATPYPTPSYDPASYIPAVRAGKTVTVRGVNLAEKIQAAQDDASVATVRIEGGGSISKQVTLRKHTVFDSSTYSCDMQGITDQGQFLIADGVKVEGTWRMPQELIDYFKFGDGKNWRVWPESARPTTRGSNKGTRPAPHRRSWTPSSPS